MDDIVPELLEKIQQSFVDALARRPNAVQLLEQVQTGAGGYAKAAEFADEIGAAMSEAFAANLSSAVLPDGRMYWNIADRVVRPMLEQDYQLVSEAAQSAQQTLNGAAGIGLRAQTAPLDNDRVDGILNRLCEEEQYDHVAWLLDKPVKTFSRVVVDDTLKANVDFHGKAGLHPRIIRTAESHCCKWCRNLAGTYAYPDVPRDVYRRHNNCRCMLEYDPGDGDRDTLWRKGDAAQLRAQEKTRSGSSRQNAHTKQWKTYEERARIKERKRFSATEQAAKPKPVKEKAATWNDASGSLSWPKTKRKAMYSAEYGTTRSRVEVSRLYASDGRQLFKKSGDVSSVVFTAKEIRQMRSGVLTHNHPGGGCFSPNDINMLRYGKLREIRAVTSEGVYRMQAPASWSRKISSLEKIDQAYYEIDAAVSKEFFDKARAGEISYREADNLSQRAVVQTLCKKYNIPFEFDSWDDIREMM